MSKEAIDAMIQTQVQMSNAHNAMVQVQAALRDRTLGPVARFARITLARAGGVK